MKFLHWFQPRTIACELDEMRLQRDCYREERDLLEGTNHDLLARLKQVTRAAQPAPGIIRQALSYQPTPAQSDTHARWFNDAAHKVANDLETTLDAPTGRVR